MEKKAEDSPTCPCGNDDEGIQMALDRLSRHAFELGLYDRNEMPEAATDE